MHSDTHFDMDCENEEIKWRVRRLHLAKHESWSQREAPASKQVPQKVTTLSVTENPKFPSTWAEQSQRFHETGFLKSTLVSAPPVNFTGAVQQPC